MQSVSGGFGVGIIEMILMLASLGVFTAIVLLSAFAAITKRPALAVLMVVALLLTVSLGSVVVSLFPYQSSRVHHAAHVEQLFQSGSPPVGFQNHFDDGDAPPPMQISRKSINFAGLLLFAALPVIGIIALFRWLKSRGKCAEGKGRGFPVFAIVLIAIVLFGWFRWRAASPTYEAVSVAERHAMEVQRDFERTARERTPERVRVPSPPVNLQNSTEFKAAMKQLKLEQRKVAIQLAQAQNQVASAIDSADIHELMDAFDAPDIYLPPMSPAGPMSIISPFQLVKQFAASTPESLAPPAVPVAPVSTTPPSPLAATTVAAEKAVPASGIAVEAELPTAERQPNDQASEAPASESAPAVATEPVAMAKVASSVNSARPKWVDAPSETVNGRWSRVIVVGDYVTEDECQAATNKKLHEATNEYIKQFAAASSPNVEFQDPLAIMGLGTNYLRDQIAKEQYVETVERSVGPMKKLYTRMVIDPNVQRDLQHRWSAYQRQFRFGLVGLGAGSILGVVGLTWGLLRIDTATKGYYTKRLFLGVPAAIIGLIALLAALA